MLAVQECYISVCKEKNMLEKEEALIRENEVCQILKCVYQKQLVPSLNWFVFVLINIVYVESAGTQNCYYYCQIV